MPNFLASARPMTQLRRELESADGASDSSGSGHSDAAGAESWGAEPVEDLEEPLAEIGSGPLWAPRADLDELCGSLRSLRPEEAEREVRDALRSAGAEASAADTLGLLLKVFRLVRDTALEGYEGWDVAVAYCDHLTRICDQNFVGTVGGEADGQLDFPAVAVATVYAECGRTLALADQLPAARERLQTALSVFGVVPSGTTDPAVQLQIAGTNASLGRVLRRMGQLAAAQAGYLKALQLYAELPATADLPGFIGEYCEVLEEAGAEELSDSMPSLLLELAEEKLGGGSDAHLVVLRDVAALCTRLGKPRLAAPALATRARLLRIHAEGGVAGGSVGRSRSRPDALALAEVEAAEEEAAQALETTVAESLEEGNLEQAAGAWEEALHFREQLDPGGAVVVEMHRALTALRQAMQGDGAQPNQDMGVLQSGSQEAEDHNDPQVTEAVAESAASPVAEPPPRHTEATRSLMPRPVSLRPQVPELRPVRRQFAPAPRAAVEDGWDA